MHPISVTPCEWMWICVCLLFVSLHLCIWFCISYHVHLCVHQLWSKLINDSKDNCLSICMCLCVCLFVYLLACMSLFVSFKTVLIWNQACCQLLCKILSLITSIVCNFKMFQNQLMEECLKATQVFMLLSSSREESDPSTMLPMVFWENFNTTISS